MAEAPNKKLPIPLKCSPKLDPALKRCSLSLDNGACKLPTEFMCPYFLWFQATYPDKVGDAPQEYVNQLKAMRPIPLDVPLDVLVTIRSKHELDPLHGDEETPGQKARAVKKASKRSPLKKGGGKKPAVKKAAVKKSGAGRKR